MSPRVRLWCAALAVFGILALALAFEHVVRQGVWQAGMRQAALSRRNHALWLCEHLQTRQARADCREAPAQAPV
jgi:hypothetical protein